ncbi:MAG: DUF4416 family protein [Dehalococcoidia bacterium]|nr:DUF4416 family protein [Dehalococcoidia bacterium]
MGEIRQPEPVMLFIGLLIAPSCALVGVYRSLEERVGPIELKSQIMDFDYTRYYEPEMGSGLSRQFLAFERLVLPDELPRVKIATNALEKELAQDGKRRVNLDPGYLTGAKLVLVTTKDHAHRLYLGRGIYGEITLMFQRGKFEALPWTYPDYRSQGYQEFFQVLRERYLSKVSEARSSAKGEQPK